mmetsp:Transcript_38284/g.58123  ORF Transcript_38284/g.58123 Transcript_38284/m.58123 type:complete len:342 (-) Transcript_38284:151-1176(-)
MLRKRRFLVILKVSIRKQWRRFARKKKTLPKSELSSQYQTRQQEKQKHKQHKQQQKQQIDTNLHDTYQQLVARKSTIVNAHLTKEGDDSSATTTGGVHSETIDTATTSSSSEIDDEHNNIFQYISIIVGGKYDESSTTSTVVSSYIPTPLEGSAKDSAQCDIVGGDNAVKKEEENNTMDLAKTVFVDNVNEDEDKYDDVARIKRVLFTCQEIGEGGQGDVSPGQEKDEKQNEIMNVILLDDEHEGTQNDFCRSRDVKEDDEATVQSESDTPALTLCSDGSDGCVADIVEEIHGSIEDVATSVNQVLNAFSINEKEVEEFVQEVKKFVKEIDRGNWFLASGK